MAGDARDITGRFPAAPGLPRKTEAFLKAIDDVYVTDAYHSLSIEGYQVTTELIERVRRGNWHPDKIAADGQQRDALAAGGYPWAVIPLEKPESYMAALEDASVKQNIRPFGAFLGELVDSGLKVT